MDGGQAYTLDALVSLIVLVLALLVVVNLTSIAPVTTPTPPPAERVLGVLLLRYEIQGAIYTNDVRTLRAYLESVLPSGTQYYLAVFDGGWNLLFEVGKDVEGVSAVAQLTGFNGTVEVRYVVLKVRI